MGLIAFYTCFGGLPGGVRTPGRVRLCGDHLYRGLI
jgi:hypothetical protein